MSVPSFNSHNSVVKEAAEPSILQMMLPESWGRYTYWEFEGYQGEINRTGMQSPRVCYKLPVLDFDETELNNSIPVLCSNPHPRVPAHLNIKH